MKRFLKAYQYLFYRVYFWQLRLWGKEDAPHITAVCTIALLIFCHLLTILSIIYMCFGLDLYVVLHPSKMQIVMIAAVLFWIIYQIFAKNKKYLNFIKEYKRETKASYCKGTIFIICYVVMTIGVLIFFAYLAGKAMDAKFTVFNYLHNRF